MNRLTRAITLGRACVLAETRVADRESWGILGNASPCRIYSIEKERTNGELKAHLHITEALRQTATKRATPVEK